MKHVLLIGIFTVSIGLAGLCSCSDDAEAEFPNLVPGISDIENTNKKLDYTRLDGMGHPRLLMTPEDFIAIKGQIGTSVELKGLHDHIVARSESILALPDLEYVLTGRRLLSVSNQALYRIFYCAYAYWMTGDDRFLVKAERDMNTVCRFPGWNPDHYLDVAEMATAVAIGYDWLYNELQESTRKTVHTALENYVFNTSDKNTDKFIDRTNNWNQVCNCGLVLSALAMYEDFPDRCRAIIERSVEANRAAVAEYSPDGNYPEGYGYWDYGTSFQVCMLTALDKIFGSDKGLSEIEGFSKTPEYMLYMVGTAGVFNYSDNGSGNGPQLAMWWFARKYADNSLLYHEVAMLKSGAYTGTGGAGAVSVRLLPMIMPFVAGTEFSEIPLPSKKLWAGHGVAPVVLVRTGWNDAVSDKFVGIKGGKARTSHGHMDGGSFVYDALGCRWAMDLGRDDYTTVEANMSGLWSYTQTSNRWTLLRYKNTYHNTLSLDNAPHQVSGACTISRIYDTDESRGALLNTAPLYGDMVTAATRSVVLENGKDLVVEDKLTIGAADRTVRWHMVTPATPVRLNDRCWQLERGGRTLYLTVTSEQPVSLKTWSTAPEREWEEANPGTVVVGFESQAKARQQVAYTVRLTADKP